MSQPNVPNRCRSAARRLLAVLGPAITCLALSASPASAHTDLISTDPEAGARLSAPPSEVSFTFSDQMSGEFNTLTLSVDGRPSVKLRATTTGDTITARVPPRAVGDATTGAQRPVTWTVSYRVVSADGHPVTGDLAFRAPFPQRAVDDPSAATAPTAPDSSAPVSPSGEESSPTAAEQDQGTPWWVVLIGLGLALLVGAGVSITLVRQSTQRRALDG